MDIKKFAHRHVGPSSQETKEMLNTIGLSSVEELIKQTVPANIRLAKDLNLPEGTTEFEYANHIAEVASMNQIFRNHIGMGYYGTIVPAVIQRNILENPGWYTAYTPYQAEIAQGRLEALLNFQTMISSLTGFEIANASLLDESTAAAEAMIMLYNSRSREAVKDNVLKFFVSEDCFPQTIDVIVTRATPLAIEVVVDKHENVIMDKSFFGALLQYPAKYGAVETYSSFIDSCKASEVKVIMAADVMSLVMLKSPAELGADVAVGSTQRFGIPMGFGGPHAAYFATKDEYKRVIPGRIIGVSVDRLGKKALRMALQTREQHIRREKATSNICTAQALLAIMAGMYAVFHGKEGIKGIANDIHTKTSRLNEALTALGYKQNNTAYFDTLHFTLPSDIKAEQIRSISESKKLNFFYINSSELSINIDETTTEQGLLDIVSVFADVKKAKACLVPKAKEGLQKENLRTSEVLEHPIFNSFHSESEMMRYIKKLENKDLSLTHSMISLGSCTMKLNAASELYPITNPAFANMHPFAPESQTKGYQYMIEHLGKWLCEITGFDAMSFQPNSGAQGEYAGLLVIREYHIQHGNPHRTVALIPSSAHGTNPASAAMAGMDIVVVKCDEKGNIDISDLKAKAEQHKDKLSCMMVTYPSTHGVFEAGIKEMTDIIHQNGGLVYMDGANMNAQVGLTNPATIGADVCHLNLHKTFAIPHGGGGPGMGPIGVNKKLAPYLPGHPLYKTGGEKAVKAVSAAPFGSALILLISYGYVKMLGKTGVREATEYAILNANYMKARLKTKFPVLYEGANGRVAHEMIIDCRPFKRTAGVEVEDIAKRLMDYGFHAPTVSFPVAGTLMIEPTESEGKAELDRFCDALLNIYNEISEIENGTEGKEDNVLKNAPHTAEELTSDAWIHSYQRSKAAYPLAYVKNGKFWPSVSRIDSAHGDRNLICTCPSIEEYA